jgi:hypothetical protein
MPDTRRGVDRYAGGARRRAAAARTGASAHCRDAGAIGRRARHRGELRRHVLGLEWPLRAWGQGACRNNVHQAAGVLLAVTALIEAARQG